MCFLELKCSREVDWLRCGMNHQGLLGYELKTSQIFNVPPLQAIKTLKVFSSTLVEVSCPEVHWVPDIQFASVDSFEVL